MRESLKVQDSRLDMTREAKQGRLGEGEGVPFVEYINWC